ncbi:hypothetical protein [Actinoplanes sp. CA-252034]|uniref:hypothetical protein n=1 Tax=Actinoplanes sp. CA-252034 TaxID=3239906 RepID=UPI003D959ED1
MAGEDSADWSVEVQQHGVDVGHEPIEVGANLRHACLSGWLNAGVSAALVATWAGHSIAVPLKIYANCLYGEQEAALRGIEAFRQGYATPEAA